MEDCSSLERCIFLRNLRFLSVAGIKHGICVTTDLEELNLYVDDCDRYDLQSRKKEYHWTIFVLILPLIRYSGTEFDSHNSHFPYIAFNLLCMPQPSGKAGHALSVILSYMVCSFNRL